MLAQLHASVAVGDAGGVCRAVVSGGGHIYSSSDGDGRERALSTLFVSPRAVYLSLKLRGVSGETHSHVSANTATPALTT